MFILQLNDMRSSNIEIETPVCRAISRKTLLALVEKERVEPYRDGFGLEFPNGRWCKSFKKDGILEWYNLPHGAIEHSIIDVGTEEDWAERAKADYRERVLNRNILYVAEIF